MSTVSSKPTKSYHYLAYGADLHPKLLSARLGPIKPLSSTPVIVPSAFLSFDVQGIPFSSPACTNAIIQGVNDVGWTVKLSKSRPIRSNMTSAEKEKDEEYREWIWRRCCPGLDYTGLLPPRLEGVAFELTEADFRSIVLDFSQPTSSSSSAKTHKDTSRSEAAWPSIPIECQTFTPGDSSKTTGILTAYIPIAPLTITRRPNLQPSNEYVRLVILGAFGSLLSQPYLGHLVLLRPYLPMATIGKRIGRFMINLVMIPPFLCVHMPLYIMGFGFRQTFVARNTDRLVSKLVGKAKGALSWFTGSGWWNESELQGEAKIILDDKGKVVPQSL
ncbi:BQ2448_6516 [Microbotryum intermedium]|uniref:BQ2448_6516 protein n=1 Tax=Microbotryum intermedium TaxID=269621 RepID=A0A238FQC2_9BASI|nr:BQ2448_6516 [Microbotryum intermedium]